MTAIDPSAGFLRSIHYLPQSRNEHFVGRGRVLESLHQALSRGGEAGGRVQVVYGAPGVGKSHLALEYAYRHRETYGLMWWLPADEPNTLAVHFGRLAEWMGLKSSSLPAGADIRDAVRRELRKRDDWLLIFDSAPDPEALKPYLPERNGRVLITSRNPKWDGIGKSFCLRVLERAESIDFLLRRTKLPLDHAAHTLAQALGDLPLALEQAGALIAESELTFGGYLRRYEDHWAELLQSGRTPGDYPDTVAMTWELACRAVEQADPEVAALLKIVSFWAPTEISRSLLARKLDVLPVPLSTRFANAGAVDGAIQTLGRYSLLSADERSVFVHHLVGALTRDRLPEEQQYNWCELALEVMERTFQFDETAPSTWTDAAQALPHALAVAGHAEALDLAPAINAKLLNRVGEYLQQVGRFAEARGAFERALALTDSAHGPDDPRHAAVANNLGRALRRLGDLQQARAHFEAALVLDQRAYGDNHPHVAEIVNNYGAVLHQSGDVQTALKQFEWALEICLNCYGAEHPKVATLTNNVGYALATSGELDRALDQFTQALAIGEAACGPNHPLVANIRTNFGIALRVKGLTDEAQAEFERAAAIGESVLGPDHSDVARTLGHLGSIHQQRNDLTAARQCFERALRIDERALGPEHLLIIARLNDLGRCLKSLGDVEGSARCYERAADILQKNQEFLSSGSAAAMA